MKVRSKNKLNEMKEKTNTWKSIESGDAVHVAIPMKKNQIDWCKKMGLSKSILIERLIDQYIKKVEDSNKEILL